MSGVFFTVTISFSMVTSGTAAGAEEGAGVRTVSVFGQSIVSSQFLMLASESLPDKRLPSIHDVFSASVCNSLSLSLMLLPPDVQNGLIVLSEKL